MAISLYNIQKWYKMLTGQSVLHVNQDLGENFRVDTISGYYNNLTMKVLMQKELLNTEELPKVLTEDGEYIYFPVAIFQYGLGAYDLYLQTGEEKYKAKFFQCCEWAINNQESTGAWSNFFFIYKDHPYGAMAQGEGTSLLLRGYVQTRDERFLIAAKRSIDFMLMPVDEGGTTIYRSPDIVFLEYTHLPVVLNGWIFSLFGLYDAALIIQDGTRYKRVFDDSVVTLLNALDRFDNGYWSLYDLGNHIASPFYHNLHIAQMQALYEITKENKFKVFADKWTLYQNRNMNKFRAFIVKAYQKIIQ